MDEKERKAYDQGLIDGLNKAMRNAETMKLNADGCKGCAFEDTYEWELPCTKCQRNCKDYWRAKVTRL